jgi:hypothetical protein
MPIPEWYHPIPGANPEAFREAVGYQLGLTQRGYDPTGAFAQQGEADWLAHASRDTRGISGLPAIYQAQETNLIVRASIGEDGTTQVAVGVQTDPDGTPDVYHNADEEQLPLIVALLGEVASMELAELEAHPRRAIHALSEAPGASFGMERSFAQKTLELPGTPGGAINLTYFTLLGGAMGKYDVRLARQIAFPEATYLYQQNIVSDARDADTLLCWPRAFRLDQALPMGTAYPDAEIYGDELGMKATDGFEARLRRAGNALVGIVEAADIGRIVSEPLRAQYQLHA